MRRDNHKPAPCKPILLAVARIFSKNARITLYTVNKLNYIYLVMSKYRLTIFYHQRYFVHFDMNKLKSGFDNTLQRHAVQKPWGEPCVDSFNTSC